MQWVQKVGVATAERAFSSFKWLTNHRGSVAALPAHLATGIDGENAAFFYLRRKGYIVVARRWSSGNLPGDLDLIAWHGPMLCFIEVKTRTAHDITPAEAAVDSHKRNTLRRLARQYIRQLLQEERPPARFDVLSVYLVPGQKKEFQHFEASFGWTDERGRDGWEDRA